MVTDAPPVLEALSPANSAVETPFSGRLSNPVYRVPEQPSGYSVTVYSLTDLVFQQLLQNKGELWQDWQQLWVRLNPRERDCSSHPAWLTAWLTHFGQRGQDVRLFVVRQGSRLVSVVPMEVVWNNRRWLLPQCHLVARADSPLEGGSLAVRESDRSGTLKAILDCPLFPRDTRATNGNCIFPQFLRFEQVDGTHHLRSETNLPIEEEPVRPRAEMRVPANFAELTPRLSTSLRKSLKRGKSKMAIGESKIDNCHGADLHWGLNRLATLESNSWKGEQRTDLLADRPLYQFFGSVLDNLPASGSAVVRVLTFQGRDVAAQLGLRFGATLHLHKIGYDQEVHMLSPGSVLMADTLTDYAVREGIEAVNLVTYQSWNDAWGPELKPTFMVDVFPSGLRGSLAALRAVRVKTRIKRLLHHWNALR